MGRVVLGSGECVMSMKVFAKLEESVCKVIYIPKL